MAIFGDAAVDCVRALVSAGARVPRRWRLGNAALFFNDEYAYPNECFGRDARTSDGDLGAGVWRDDAHWWPGVWVSFACGGCAGGNCGGGDCVRDGGVCDVVGGEARGALNKLNG